MDGNDHAPRRVRRRAWRRALTWLALGSVGCSTVTYLPEPLPTYLADHPASLVPACATPEAPPEGKPPIVTLPGAVQECVLTNLRIRAGVEKIHQARADFTTEGLIPNSTLFTDAQLLPLTRADLDHQSGPPQFDALLTVPIDWWLFGKRVASMEAARLQVDVAAADFANLVRQRISDTVSGFYDVLETRELAKLAKEDIDDFLRIEEITKKQVEAGGAGAVELDRVRLAVLDARRELRRREAAAQSARAKLRPLLGRTANDTEFEIEGTLNVTAAAPAPTLAQAILLAEAHRPDLLSDRRSIEQARAAIEREHRKARAQVSLQPGLSYQHQKSITGFPNALLFNIGLTTTLPISDKNQGNIEKAESTLRQSDVTLQADLADIKAEIELALTDYRTALAAVTAEDPATLEAAKGVRDKTEQAYKAGGRRLLELLDAQRVYRDRVRATVSSRADYWRSLNRLNAAVGLRALDDATAPPAPPNP